jgi:hypothetical protein
VVVIKSLVCTFPWKLYSLFCSLFKKLGFELSLHLEPLHQPFFVMGFYFQDRVSRTICLGWLRTAILLICAPE